MSNYPCTISCCRNDNLIGQKIWKISNAFICVYYILASISRREQPLQIIIYRLVPRYIIISFVCPSVHHDVRCGWYLKERFSHLGELVPFRITHCPRNKEITNKRVKMNKLASFACTSVRMDVSMSVISSLMGACSALSFSLSLSHLLHNVSAL